VGEESVPQLRGLSWESGLNSTHKEVDGDEEVDDSYQAPGGRGSKLGKKKKKKKKKKKIGGIENLDLGRYLSVYLSGQVLPQKSADELQAILVVLVRISPKDLVVRYYLYYIRVSKVLSSLFHYFTFNTYFI